MAKAPKLIKKDSQIEFPAEVLNEKDDRKKMILKKLYKNFIVNLTEDTARKTKEIVEFLYSLIGALYKLFKLGTFPINKTMLTSKTKIYTAYSKGSRKFRINSCRWESQMPRFK